MTIETEVYVCQTIDVAGTDVEITDECYPVVFEEEDVWEWFGDEQVMEELSTRLDRCVESDLSTLDDLVLLIGDLKDSLKSGDAEELLNIANRLLERVDE